MSVSELTKEQEQQIREAYIRPVNKVSRIVDRIKQARIPVQTATSWLFIHGYIGYDDKQMLDGMA